MDIRLEFRVNELRKLPNLHLHRDLNRKRKIKGFKSESGKFTQVFQEFSRKTINRKTFGRFKPLDI